VTSARWVIANVTSSTLAPCSMSSTASRSSTSWRVTRSAAASVLRLQAGDQIGDDGPVRQAGRQQAQLGRMASPHPLYETAVRKARNSSLISLC
jgi:hypothetical protein